MFSILSKAVSARCALWVCVLVLAITPTANAAGKWQYELTPYLWAAGIKGVVGLGNAATVVDARFDDLFTHLDTGVMVVFAARSPQWATWVDVIDLKFAAETERKLVTARGEVDQTIVETAVSYKPHPRDLTEWYFGVRYVDIGASVDLVPIGSRSGQDDWIDPLVGARAEHKITNKLSIFSRTDIGGFGIGSDLSWHFSIAGRYQFTKNISTTLAYRYLEFDYEEDNFSYDVAMSGLGLGLTISF